MDGVVPERDPYQAHLSLGGGIDPTSLELFAEGARVTLDADAPSDVIDARFELGATELPRAEKPWIHDLAGQIVAFCRIADRAPDVIFVWALP